MADSKASLSIDGKVIAELPILSGSAGNDVIDIRTLGGAGYFTYDPGFLATASCESAITFIDGGKGVLQHRGYPIDSLAKQADYLEVCYILLNGEAPNKEQYEEFRETITNHTMVHEKIAHFFHGFLPDAHPMAMLCGVVGALSSFYHSDLDINEADQRMRSAPRLIAKMPTISAMAYKYSIGQPFVYPRNDLTYAENFLHMMFSVPAEEYKVSPTVTRAMDRIFTLHADHEQNASTSTVRLAGSSGANPYACIAAGVASLWGPAHGGANEACLTMLEEIGSLDRVDEFVAKAKDKSDPFRLMGFGHRVYKNFDPRARIIKVAADDVLNMLGIEDPVLDIAKGLEKEALEDPYFVDRKLYPNVDFYSGIIYRALGIPVEMFTVMFALGRLPGWIAQWKEMRERKEPIGRPRQIYVGENFREFTSVSER